jgi:hypothetical protein
MLASPHSPSRPKGREGGVVSQSRVQGFSGSGARLADLGLQGASQMVPNGVVAWVAHRLGDAVARWRSFALEGWWFGGV